MNWLSNTCTNTRFPNILHTAFESFVLPHLECVAKLSCDNLQVKKLASWTAPCFSLYHTSFIGFTNIITGIIFLIS